MKTVLAKLRPMGQIIYVDADACPVKDEIIKVANRHRLTVCLVSNGGIRPHRDPLVQIVIVAEGPDVADKWIADRASPGDIVVTSDIPLAAKVVAKAVVTLRHNGDEFTAQNIGAQLATRDLMADLRAADPLMMGAGKQHGNAFSKQDRSRFLERLEVSVHKAKGLS